MSKSRKGQSEESRVNTTDASAKKYPITLKRAIKDIEILNGEGDAIVTWKRSCVNTCERDLSKILHKGRHDGILENCLVHVKGKDAYSSLRKFEVTETDGEENPLRLSREFRLSIDLTREKIRSGQPFNYDYSIKYKGVFENFTKKDAEWTSYEVYVPTEHLTIVIAAPEGYVFDPSGSDVRVKGLYDIDDFREEQRCKDEFPPMALQQGKLLIWEIGAPKIACTYSLHFLLKSEHTHK